MCAKVSKRVAPANAKAKKKAAPRAAQSVAQKRPVARKTTGRSLSLSTSRQTEHDTDSSDEDDIMADTYEANSNASSLSNDGVEEDFLHYRDFGQGNASDLSNRSGNQEPSSSGSSDETPRRSFTRSPHSSFTRSPDYVQAAQTSSPTRQSVRRSAPPLPQRRPSLPIAGPSSHAAPEPAGRRKSRKQSNPMRKDRIVREIIRAQRSTKLLIPLASFQRVVREIFQRNGGDMRVQTMALSALQEAAEMYLVQLFEDATMTLLHRNRVTMSAKDIQLVLSLRRNDPGKP